MVRHEELFSYSHSFFFNPLHHNISMHILHTVLYTFPKGLADEESLFTDQKLLLLVIISFILMTLMFDSALMLYGEIRC